MYIKKITIKFGSFVFATRKITYNPDAEDEQLEMLIPNIRPYLAQRNGARSDLTFKIVKTADNSMSIVKKSDPSVVPSNQSPHSYTSATPSVMSTASNGQDDAARNKTSTADASQTSSPKNGSMNPRVMVNKDASMQRYQVMHRDSLDDNSDSVGNTEMGKVKAVILKRKSMAASSMSSKKRARSGSNDVLNENEKKKIDILMPHQETQVPTQSNENNESNKMPDVMLLETSLELKSSFSSTQLSSTPDQSQDILSPSKSTQHNEDAGLFVPMVEVKHEVNEEDELITVSSSRSSLNASGPVTASVDIKMELMSDDDELDGDDIMTETTPIPTDPLAINEPQTVSKPTTMTVEVKPRGNITVKDMAKLKNPPVIQKPEPPQPQPTLLKTVFRKAKTKDPNALKAVTITRTNVPNTPKANNFNSMVYIPMGDGKQFNNEATVSKPKDPATNNKTYLNNPTKTRITSIMPQPPPLTSVSTAAISIQTMSTNTTPSSTIQPHAVSNSNAPTPNSINFITSCPPPLVASLPNSQMQSPNMVVIQSAPRPVTPVRHFLGDMVTDNLAKAVTDTLARGTPPRLVAKPAGALRSDGVCAASNNDAGPVSKMLIDNAHKVSVWTILIYKNPLEILSQNT